MDKDEALRLIANAPMFELKRIIIDRRGPGALEAAHGEHVSTTRVRLNQLIAEIALDGDGQ